jgi:D-alanyl-D-alanine carboxypeptidase (penicillin-binding protein 5/6)
MNLAAILSLVAALGAPLASPHPLRVPPPPISDFPVSAPPDIDARSWMVWAVDEDAPLGEKEPDLVVAPASITKLMTAMLTSDNLDLSNPITISANADTTPIGFVGQPDVRQGEVWTVRELLVNILVQSGNDAAVALAESVAGDTEAFVELMNERAADLGMGDTIFLNPNGLDTSGHVSTARDLIRMGVAALGYPDLLRLARIKHIEFDRGGRHLEIDATNRLLGVFPGYFGLKTGDTIAAGQVLLSYTETSHKRIVAVVLGSAGRRVATRELVTWAMSALGPRDQFLAGGIGTDAAEALPEWYQLRLAAVRPLDPGTPIPPERTPLTEDLEARFRELLPEVLGGGE